MLQGKTAVVTGGTGALGEAVVAAFLEAGARVAVVSRNGPTSEAVARPDVLWLAADVLNTHSMAEAVAQTAARFGQVDILAHLVGSWYGAPVAETPLARWREQLDINLTSAFVTAQAVLPGMLAHGSGVILAVGSRPAVERAAGNAAYAIAKLGVVKLMQTIDEEYRKQGIRANVVLPSVIDTPANRRDMPNADHTRWVQPSEIAAVLRFLASDAASAVSGAVVPVYGKA